MSDLSVSNESSRIYRLDRLLPLKDGLAQQGISFFLKFDMTSGIKKQTIRPQMTRAEQETETEANRLIEQIEAALAAVVMRSTDDSDSLEAAADRVERAARYLLDCLRKLA